MKTLNATELRGNLFSALDDVLKGVTILVRTRRGSVLLSKAHEEEQIEEARRAKISGCIHGDLADADAALRKHIQWPRK